MNRNNSLFSFHLSPPLGGPAGKYCAKRGNLQPNPLVANPTYTHGWQPLQRRSMQKLSGNSAGNKNTDACGDSEHCNYQVSWDSLPSRETQLLKIWLYWHHLSLLGSAPMPGMTPGPKSTALPLATLWLWSRDVLPTPVAASLTLLTNDFHSSHKAHFLCDSIWPPPFHLLLPEVSTHLFPFIGHRLSWVTGGQRGVPEISFLV